MVLLVMIIVTLGFSRFARGGIYWPAATIGMLLLAVAIAKGLLWQEQWYVVPGGLVRRKTRGLRSAWDLHLFDRRRSVLMAVQISRHQWQMIVADRDLTATSLITHKEAEVALRAWLSPLAPPSLDRMADLA